jgi:hypothetical protein
MIQAPMQYYSSSLILLRAATSLHSQPCPKQRVSLSTSSMFFVQMCRCSDDCVLS